jgi:LL-diaminopimelate aminotransferase
MVKRNPNIAKLKASYLFPEINMRRQQFLAKHPDAKLISLGIGNTTEPITPSITLALERSAKRQGTLEGYTGYGPEQGLLELRQRIANGYYNDRISADEMFISDGSKCDIGRLQQLFGSEVTIAVQDPSYPVYVDGSVITGLTGSYDSERGHYPGIVYMPCTPENRSDLLLLAKQPDRGGSHPSAAGSPGGFCKEKSIDHHLRRCLCLLYPRCCVAPLHLRN